MSEIDIRNNKPPVITKIVFADEDDAFTKATNLKLMASSVAIEEDNGCDNVDVRVRSVEHAENLIKALQKAIELNWFDKIICE